MSAETTALLQVNIYLAPMKRAGYTDVSNTHLVNDNE